LVSIAPCRAGNSRVEQDVAAKSRLDFVFLRQLVGVVRSGKDLQCLLPRFRAQCRHIFVIEERLQAPPDALVRKQLGGGFVDQMSVLNGLDAGGDRLADRPRHICVNGNVSAPILCGLDRCMDLRFGILDRFDRIVGRGDAAARHQLDLARAVPQLLSRA
jgi:hypothetical protein